MFPPISFCLTPAAPMPETVFITGASSGIGLELAKLFAADGSRLILLARREERLRELADQLRQQHQTESLILAADLSDPATPQQVCWRIAAQGWDVDVLVNNAGFGQLGQFAEIPLPRQLAMVQVNISALMELTHRLLPGMISRGRGAVLNLASTAAFQPGPHCAAYYATKAFVLSFSEALYEELREQGISVTCLCPGPTRTEFGEESNMHATPVFKYNAMSVEAVARAGHRGVRRGARMVMPGLKNNLLSASVRFTPRPLILKIMKLLQPLPK